ncbi:MAG: MBL fold metallo-hydrolase [Kofleriaceae bacterium]|nr:MBL fold metallo-hydrolase [Kofleriaceae bacterium]
MRALGAVVMLIVACGGPTSSPAPETATGVLTSCDGRMVVVPSTTTFIDPGTGAPSTSCTRIVRVTSFVGATPELRARIDARFGSETYLVRGDDGAIVMIDGGWTHHVTGFVNDRPVIEENLDLRAELDAAIGLLRAGSGLADVEAFVIDHAHVDHVMQGRWVGEARVEPLDVWVGEADRAFVTDRGAVLDCTAAGANPPDALVDLIPLYVGADYRLHTVPTPATPTLVDVGHGVRVAVAPSHTPGALLAFVPSLGVVVGNNHLLRHARCGDASTENDCVEDLENSACHVPCDAYTRTAAALIEALASTPTVFLPVHASPELTRCP